MPRMTARAAVNVSVCRSKIGRAMLHLHVAFEASVAEIDGRAYFGNLPALLWNYGLIVESVYVLATNERIAGRDG